MSKLFYLLSIFFLVIYCPLQGQESQEFFLDGFNPKDASIPPFEYIDSPNKKATVNIKVSFTDTIAKVSKYIYGNNANTYMTQMVTQPELIDYIKE